jgi:ribosomal protein S18 acetylase RimI-like enzyme
MVTITRASRDDAAQILVLQRLAYQSEARLYQDSSLPPLTQSLDSLLDEFTGSVVLKALADERLVGSVRARGRGEICEIGRLIVGPEFQRQGIGSSLLRSIEACFPTTQTYELFTGTRSESNIRLYRRYGYVIARTRALSSSVSLVYLRKVNVLSPFT